MPPYTFNTEEILNAIPITKGILPKFMNLYAIVDTKNEAGYNIDKFMRRRKIHIIYCSKTFDIFDDSRFYVQLIGCRKKDNLEMREVLKEAQCYNYETYRYKFLKNCLHFQELFNTEGLNFIKNK